VAPLTKRPTTSKSLTLITYLFLTFFASLAIYWLRPPEVQTLCSPSQEFSAQRAMKLLETIARRPHPAGSPEHREVEIFIRQELTRMGLTPIVHEAIGVPKRGSASIYNVHNILAKLPGRASTKSVLLAAHYDSVLGSPGASDDGAAVGALLETLRALGTGYPLKNNLILLLTDGEELGLLGAKAFIEDHPWSKDIGIVLNFEARGTSGPVLMFETSSGNGWLIQEFAKSSPFPVANSLMYEIYRLMPNDTDFTVFKKAGLSGLNFAFIDDWANYHTKHDTLETLDQRSLQHHGSYALALTRHFGNLDLKNTKSTDAVYFNCFGSRLVVYSVKWVMPLMALVGSLFAGMTLLGFKKGQLDLFGIAIGWVALAVCIIVALLIVTSLLHTLRAVYAYSDWAPWKSPPHTKLYMMGIVALTFGITAGMYEVFLKWTRLQNLTIGALLWWLIVGTLVSWYTPGGSYLFVWPMLFNIAISGVLISTRQPTSISIGRLSIMLVCMVPSILLLVPMIYLTLVGLTLSSAGPAIILLVLFLGLLIPVLGIVDATVKWFVPVATLLAGFSFIAAGSVMRA